MSEPVCTCHCGGSMFYRHMHAESCELSRVGEEAPKSELQALRDEVAWLRADYVKLFKLAEPIAKMLGELSIQPIGCSREQELAWKMAVKNLRHYQRDNASDELQAALDGGKGVQGGTL